MVIGRVRDYTSFGSGVAGTAAVVDDTAATNFVVVSFGIASFAVEIAVFDTGDFGGVAGRIGYCYLQV